MEDHLRYFLNIIKSTFREFEITSFLIWCPSLTFVTSSWLKFYLLQFQSTG